MGVVRRIRDALGAARKLELERGADGEQGQIARRSPISYECFRCRNNLSVLSVFYLCLLVASDSFRVMRLHQTTVMLQEGG